MWLLEIILSSSNTVVTQFGEVSLISFGFTDLQAKPSEISAFNRQLLSSGSQKGSLSLKRKLKPVSSQGRLLGYFYFPF